MRNGAPRPGIGRSAPARSRSSATCARDAAFARALCARADVVLEGFRPGVAARLGIGPDDVPQHDGVLLDHGLRRDRPARAACRPRPQLPRLGGRARGHARRDARRCRSPTLRPGSLGAVTEVLAALVRRARTGHGARIVVSMTHRSHDLVAHRLDGDTGAATAHGRPRLLSHLRDRRRPASDRRGAGAGVLRTSLRADRTARPWQRASSTPTRRRSRPSSPRSSRRDRWPRGSSCSTARTSAPARSPRGPRRTPTWGRGRTRPRTCRWARTHGGLARPAASAA